MLATPCKVPLVSSAPHLLGFWAALSCILRWFARLLRPNCQDEGWENTFFQRAGRHQCSLVQEEAVGKATNELQRHSTQEADWSSEQQVCLADRVAGGGRDSEECLCEVTLVSALFVDWYFFLYIPRINGHVSHCWQRRELMISQTLLWRAAHLSHLSTAPHFPSLLHRLAYKHWFIFLNVK